MTVSSISWTIESLSPSTFNVISDLTGLVILTTTLYWLQRIYPHLVWNSIRQGHPVPVEGLLGPPSFREIMQWFPKRLNTDSPQLHLLPSRTLLIVLPCVLVVSHFAHSLSDVFLEFVTVSVDSTPAYFLSGTPSNTVPTHAILGDTYPQTQTTPPVLQTRVLQQADTIALGAHRRFSLFSPDQLLWTTDYLVGGILEHLNSQMRAASTPIPSAASDDEDDALDNSSVSSFDKIPASPEVLQVQCYRPQLLQQNTYNARESVSASYLDKDGNTETTTMEEYVAVPDCDFECTATRKGKLTLDPSFNASELPLVDTTHPYWGIAAWDSYRFGPEFYNIAEWDPFGMRDLEGDLRWYLEFNTTETELSFTRSDLWHNGRRTRDGIALALGLQSQSNDTHWNRFEPYKLLPGGVEFEVEYSVLSGPSHPLPQPRSGEKYYTLSSWSQNCPRASNDNDGSMVVDSYPIEDDEVTKDESSSTVSGCIIDVWFQTNDFLPQDRIHKTLHDNPHGRLVPIRIDVTLIDNLIVDPSMLATYAGIANRNHAINHIARVDDLSHGVNLNSIAAAYLLTREIIPGSFGVEEIRAQVGPGYIVLMVLPLLLVFALTMNTFYTTKQSSNTKTEESENPIPRTVWEVMILGRKQSPLMMPMAKDDGEQQQEQSPIRPQDIKFGIPLRNADSEAHDTKARLALNNEFERNRTIKESPVEE